MEEQKRNSFTIPVAIVVAGALIAGALFLTNKKSPNTVKTDEIKNAKSEIQIEPVTAEDHILGNPKAPIMIVEFSDTECPFCKNFHTTMHKVIDTYGKTGKVAWVYRHFPLYKPDEQGRALHSKAGKESEATECAAEIGGNEKFWEYLDLLYKKTPSNNDLDLSLLPYFAEEIGLDKKEFETCLNSEKYAEKISESVEKAKIAGGQGTPYTVIITKYEKIPISEGAIPFSGGSVNMKLILDDLVGKN